MADAGSPLPPPTPEPSPVDTSGTPWWKNWWAVAIPIVALVAAIAFVVVGTSDDGSEEGGADVTGGVASTEGPSTTEAPPTTEASPTTEAPPATEPSATTSPPGGSEPTCSYLGTDDFGDMQVELSLTNPLGAVPSLFVTFSLTSGDDVRFFTDEDFVQSPLAEESLRIQADTLTELPQGVDEAAISCEVLAIEESIGDALEMPGPGDVCEFVEVDSFGDVQIELGFTSPFTTTEDIFVYYALRGPAGARFDDSFTVVDLVGAGETVRESEDTVTEAPSWVGDEITCDILGFEIF